MYFFASGRDTVAAESLLVITLAVFCFSSLQGSTVRLINGHLVGYNGLLLWFSVLSLSFFQFGVVN